MRPSALVALRAARGGSGGLSRPTLRQLSSSAPPPPPPAQTAAPDASRFPQPPQPRRSVGGGREMDTRDLMHTRAFLGYEARVTHPANYRYLLGSLGGHAIIDPEATMLSLRKVLGLLKKISFSGGKVLFVSTQPKLARLTRVMGEQSGHFYLARKWAPGLLSNWEKKRLQVRKAVDLSPLAERTGRLRQSDVQRSLDFKGIEAMARPPDCIVLLDATDLHQEAAAQNIPVVGVVDSDSAGRDVDYPIPANSNSIRFYHTLAHLLVRTLREGGHLRREMEDYRLGSGGGRTGGGGGSERGRRQG